MRHLKQQKARSAAGLFLAVLVFQMSLVLPVTEWQCRCGEDRPPSATCCCNCPRCIEARGGLRSYCKISPYQDGAERQELFLKSEGCSCGLGRTVLNLPADSPYLPLGKLSVQARTRAYPCGTQGPDFFPDIYYSITQPPG